MNGEISIDRLSPREMAAQQENIAELLRELRAVHAKRRTVVAVPSALAVALAKLGHDALAWEAQQRTLPGDVPVGDLVRNEATRSQGEEAVDLFGRMLGAIDTLRSLVATVSTPHEMAPPPPVLPA